MNACRRAQASLETTIVMAAVATMIVGTASVWSWVNRTMVERNDKFQETRRQAGSYSPFAGASAGEELYTFGMKNPYVWEPLQLFEPKVKPPSVGEPGEFPPDCPAGQALLDESEKVHEEFEQKLEELERFRTEVLLPKVKLLELLGALYTGYCESGAGGPVNCNDFREPPRAYQICRELTKNAKKKWGTFKCRLVEGLIEATAGLIQKELEQEQRLEDEGQRLHDQAEALQAQAYRACPGGDL